MPDFVPSTFLDEDLTVAKVAKLRKDDIKLLVEYLELSEVIPVSYLLKPALVKNVCAYLTQLGFFGQ